MRAYLAHRHDNCPALWITASGDRLQYWGLREVLRRRSRMAGIRPPQIHAFRRAFALNCLRAGMDLFTLQLLMGHADLQVLRRYLAQTDEDARKAHALASPVDTLWFLDPRIKSGGLGSVTLVQRVQGFPARTSPSKIA